MYRRLIRSAGMITVRGRVQREGEVIHVLAEHLMDLSDRLRSITNRDEPLQQRRDNDGTGRSGTSDATRLRWATFSGRGRGGRRESALRNWADSTRSRN